MTNLTIEKIAKTNADALTKSGQAAEAIMKGRTEALTESGNASRTADSIRNWRLRTPRI